MLNHFLAGRYQVIETLGEGGLAQTYIAEDHFQPSHPKCAVKLLKPASNDENFLPIARRLFVKEAEILEQLGRHPQIPQLLAHFDENKAFFIVQEFIEGHTLSTELPADHCWSENKVILMLKDVLQTLEFVHSYGVIHRDIKPNNLIRRYEDDQLVLIDFGAVKQIGDPRIITKTPMAAKTISIGTQGYMPTEQARGKPRLNSDIYALGMIGIQALTGIDPINLLEDTDGEVVWQNQAQVNDKLAAVLSKMVCYHFKDRYQSAKEVLQALESFSNCSVDSQAVAISTPINSIADSYATIRVTKVSSGQENFEVNQASPDNQKLDTETAKTLASEQPGETKISLDQSHLEQETRVETNFRKAKKAPAKDIWSTWGTKKNSVNSEKPKILVEQKQVNPEILSSTRSEKLLEVTENNSWSLWNPDDASELLRKKSQKSIENNHSNLEETSSIQTNISLPNQKIENTSQEIVLAQADISQTKLSLKNDHQNYQKYSQSKLKNTKKSQDSKYSELKDIFKINFNKAQDFFIQNTSNILINSNKKIDFKRIENNINSLCLTLFKFDKIKQSHLTFSNLIFNKDHKKTLIITSGVIISIISLATLYSYTKNQTKNQKSQFQAQIQAQTDLIGIQKLEKNQEYEACVQQAQIFPQEFSELSTIADELLNKCSASQLTVAQNLASQSKFKDAISLASQIPQDTKIQPEAQQLISQWSKKIYKIANNKYQEGNLEEAIAIASAIPTNSNLATELQTTIKQWNQDWEQNQTYLQQAEEKLKERQWQAAIEIAKQISDNTYWQDRSSSIIQKAEAEKIEAENALKNRTYTKQYSPPSYPRPVPKPIFIPGVTNIKNLPTNPNHPINDPNRDWVKEKLGRD